MRVGDLSLADLRSRLRRSELVLEIGDFDVSLATPLSHIAEDFRQLYRDYPLSPSTALVDFHVGLNPPRGVRRWVRPQVKFFLDANAPFKPLPSDQGFAMFEWGLNWCIASHAHHYLNIHAAVVERNGKALIMPGDPGSGKSTLCAALVCAGWRLLSDEMTLIGMTDGLVYPIPRPVGLKNESIDIVRERSPETYLGRVVEDTAKGSVAHMRAPKDSVDARRETAKPALIVFPKYKQGANTHLAELSRGASLLRVADNSFNYHVLGADGFQSCANLVERCDSYDFTYEKLDEAIPLLESLL